MLSDYLPAGRQAQIKKNEITVILVFLYETASFHH